MLIGSPDEIVERLQARREAFGVNYVSIQQSQIDSFAPIVARLAASRTSACDVPAVDRDRGPSDERRLVAGEKQRGRGQLTRQAPPAHGLRRA